MSCLSKRVVLHAAILGMLTVSFACTKERMSPYSPTPDDISPDPVDMAFVHYDDQDMKFVTRSWQGIPTIEVLPTGEIYIAWYSGQTGEAVGNYITLAKSKDNGLTWKKNSTIIEPAEKCRVFDPCLWYDKRNQKLCLYWAQCYNSLWDGQGGVWVTEKKDGSTTWGKPKRLSNGVMLNKPEIFNKTTALYPVAYWNKVYNFFPVPKNPQEAGINVFAESTGGKPVLRGKIPMNSSEEELAEHQILALKNGKLWAMVRGRYALYESYSSDTGKTWQLAKQFKRAGTGATSAARMHIKRLISGNILLILNDDKKRTNLTAFISRDEGQTWPYKFTIDKRMNVSYPDAAQDKNGNIYITYDRDRYVAKEIIMVKLTEKMIKDSTSVAEPQIKKTIIDN